MTETMTVAEWLSELKRIKKLLPHRFVNILKYSSKMEAASESIKNQQAYVNKQKQSAISLLERYEEVTMKIEESNLVKGFEFESKFYTIRQAILYKHFLSAQYTLLYDSFKPHTAEMQIMEQGSSLTPEQKVSFNMVPQLYYKERDIQASKEDLITLMAKINTLIDASNHSNTITIGKLAEE